MSMAVKPGYVNPLTTMKQKRIGQTAAHAQKKSEKGNDVKNLQTQQQTLQNQLLLLKSTSEGASGSTEAQKAMEQKLEELSADLKKAKSQLPQTEDTKSVRSNFDRYEHVENEEDENGIYQARQRYLYPRK